jgi:hypothetical protein
VLAGGGLRGMALLRTRHSGLWKGAAIGCCNRFVGFEARHNRQLMQAILLDKLQIAKAVNATLISLDDAPTGYKDFDHGAAKKFDPHGMARKAADETGRNIC